VHVLIGSMNERQKKILIFMLLLILTGPFAFLWLALIGRRESEEVKIEVEDVKEEKDEFEWKSIWDED